MTLVLRKEEVFAHDYLLLGPGFGLFAFLSSHGGRRQAGRGMVTSTQVHEAREELRPPAGALPRFRV